MTKLTFLRESATIRNIPMAIKKATNQRRTNTTLIEIQPTWLPTSTLCNKIWKVFFDVGPRLSALYLSCASCASSYRSAHTREHEGTRTCKTTLAGTSPIFELAIFVRKSSRRDRNLVLASCPTNSNWFVHKILGVNSCIRERRIACHKNHFLFISQWLIFTEKFFHC